jgi:N-acetylneuraminic acid mutarotase
VEIKFIVFFQSDGKDATNTCLATQPRKKTWKRLTPMPFRLFNAASAVVNDKMYIIGGMDDEKTVKKTVLEYEPTRDRWSVLAEMANGLLGACAVNLRHGLVITGGSTETGAFVADATYLGKTDEDDLAWVRLPTMLSNRYYSENLQF